MKTLQTTIITCLLLFSVSIAFAQPPKPVKSQEQKEKIESLKVGFLTEKLNLTPEEAQKFWPVYNKYKEEMKALRQDRKEMKSSAPKDVESMNEQELSAFIEQKFLFEQKTLDLKKKYLAEFKKVLPLKKVALLYKAEDEFKMHLLNQSQKGNKPEHEGGDNHPKKF